MTALLQGQTRLLARFGGSVCGATDLKFRWPRACLLPIPPAPPHDGNPPAWGSGPEGWGAGAAFASHGGYAYCQKLLDQRSEFTQVVVRVSKTPSRVAPEFPRVVPKATTFATFCPRVGFSVFLHEFHYFSLFSLEKEREREGKTGKTPSKSFLKTQKRSPRVGCGICAKLLDENQDSCSGDPNKSTTYEKSKRFPSSKRKNAHTPLSEVRNER